MSDENGMRTGSLSDVTVTSDEWHWPGHCQTIGVEMEIA